MKNPANCTPREFLRQTCRIREAAARWLELTGMREIASRPVEGDFPGEPERRAAQLRANFPAMAEAALVHPDETAELLGLLGFIEPGELDGHPMCELLANLKALLDSPEVVGFFISLARLGLTHTSGPASRSA